VIVILPRKLVDDFVSQYPRLAMSILIFGACMIAFAAWMLLT